MRLLLAWMLCCAGAWAGEPVADRDHDGLEDGVEQELLRRFAPRFHISKHECDERPAEFRAIDVAERNGTIYGQAFRRSFASSGVPYIELHYHHLWKRDCGALSHALDAEHVSALIRTDTLRAVYWYAAAHEDTACDAGNAARAETLDAEQHGPAVYISAGKHASFFSVEACRRSGCGGDLCRDMAPLEQGALLNIGEQDAPLGPWVLSRAWPLSSKLQSDFTEERLAQIDALPVGSIAFVHPVPTAVQAPLLAFSVSGRHTGSALATADRNSGMALDTAERHVRESVQGSFVKTRKAVRGWFGRNSRMLGKR